MIDDEPFIGDLHGMPYEERLALLRSRAIHPYRLITPSIEKIDREYAQIYQPYMSKEVMIDFAKQLDAKFAQPFYQPTASDVWLIKQLIDGIGLDPLGLPEEVTDQLDSYTNRPAHVEKLIRDIYQLIDDGELNKAEALTEELDTNDTEFTRLTSLIHLYKCGKRRPRKDL